MKNHISLLLLLMPLALSSKELPKKEVLVYAFEHAEELRLIKNDIASAQSMEKEYRGKGFPIIEGSVNYKYAPKQYNPYSFDLGGGGGNFSGLLDPTEPGFMNDAKLAGVLDQMILSFSEIDLTLPQNTVAMELSLKQPIFAQGKISKGLKVARMYYANLDLKYKGTQLTLAKDIINAYNSAILAEQNKKVQQQAVVLAEETHRLAKARLTSGKGNALDTLNSRYSLQQAKFALRDAEKNRYMAIKNVLTIASMDGDPEAIELSDTLVVRDFSLSQKAAYDQMLGNNFSLKQIDKGIELQKMQVKIAQCDFLPTVYAGASVSKITMFNQGDKRTWGDDQKIYIGATVPIYSGGQKVQKVKQASFEEQKLQETKQKAINQLSLALTNYYEELAVAKEECVEAKQLIALTVQAEKIASLSYEIGQITQNDLTKSKQQLSMSQLAYNSAVHKLNSAIVGIEMLLGDESLLTTKMEDN